MRQEREGVVSFSFDDPDIPIHIRASPSVHGTSVPIVNGVPVDFETSLFRGTAVVRIADLPDSDSEYFHNRKRKFQVAIQVKFLSLPRGSPLRLA